MKVPGLIMLYSVIVIGLYAQQPTNSLPLYLGLNSEWIQYQDHEQLSVQEVVENKTKLRLEADDTLELLEVKEDELGFRHFRYQQTYKGIPIEGATYLFHEKEQKVMHSNGSLIRGIDLDPLPNIVESEALSFALSHINATQYIWNNKAHSQFLEELHGHTHDSSMPKGELVILHDAIKDRGVQNSLAYKFDIYAIEPLSRQFVYIDAVSGKVLGTLERLHHCSGETSVTAGTNYSGTVNFTACSDGTLENNKGGGIKVFTANNTADTTVQVLANNTDPTAAEVFWATDKTYDYFLNTYNRNSLDDAGMPMLSWVHYKNNYNNASWNGSWMTYGDGDNILFSSFTAPDVVAHEITHGITDFSSNLIYSYESGALNESFSDIFGEVLEYYMLGSIDWLAGADFTIQPGKNSLRNLMYPNDPDSRTQAPDTYFGDYWYTLNGDNGGVHTNSGVQNYWFYLLSEGGSGINDIGYSYNVVGIGMEKAASIAYRNLTSYLTATSQYFDARIGAIQSAADLYGVNSVEVAQTRAAWCAVGVGICGPPPPCRATDSLALVALYNSTNGPNWTETWDLAEPIEVWYGLSFNAFGCLTCIDLDGQFDCRDLPGTSGNNLVGDLPTEIGNLDSLRFLDLSNNLLTNSIPAQIGNLKELTYLDLNVNELNQSIPASIGGLESLELFKCGFNNLTGNIPDEIGELSELTTLNLYRNQLSGPIPASFGNLNNLADLFLSQNQMSGCYDTNLLSLCQQLSESSNANIAISANNNFDASWVNFCANADGICNALSCDEISYMSLRALYLSTNGDSWTNNTGWPTSTEFMANPTIPAGIDMSNWYGVQFNNDGCVTCIDLDGDFNCMDDFGTPGNNLTGSLPDELSDLCDLTFLDLNSNGIEGSIPSGISALSALYYLNLASNNLNGIIPVTIGNLSNLTHLLLSSNMLGGDIPVGLGDLQNLYFLNLNDNNLTGEIPNQLGDLSSLHYLLLAGNNLSGSIPPTLANMTTLASLNLSGNLLTGPVIPELGNLNNLFFMAVSNNNLSGCYSDNLMSLCDQLNLLYSTNGYISSGNNLDASWEDFCTNASGTCCDLEMLLDGSSLVSKVYKAKNTITIGGIIPSTLNVTFDAPTIHFDPSFQVEQGAVVSTSVSGCL